MKGNMGRQKGFTLLELIITMAILAIVAGIATPAFQRMAINGNLKTAARDIAADFAQLKERAIAESRMYRISLDVTGGTYNIQQCQATGSSCASWDPNPIQVKNLVRYASDIVFAAGTAPTNYTFQTRGTVNTGTGNQETIVLRNSRNSEATIRINITGRTNVQFIMQ